MARESVIPRMPTVESARSLGPKQSRLNTKDLARGNRFGLSGYRAQHIAHSVSALGPLVRHPTQGGGQLPCHAPKAVQAGQLVGFACGCRFDPLIQRLAGDQFRESAVSLLNELAPRNASERMVATLAIATWNCALTALADGSRQDVPAEVRRLNMGLGFQGTGIASKAITTLQEMQSGNPKCVSVGKVNVEAGGQAIVGHVEAGRGPTKHRNREPIRRVKKAKRGG